jgi:hypothetical protein
VDQGLELALVIVYAGADGLDVYQRLGLVLPRLVYELLVNLGILVGLLPGPCAACVSTGDGRQYIYFLWGYHWRS